MLNYFIGKFNHSGEIYLSIKARPGASATTTKEILADETIKIDIAAPPTRGRANQELIKFLAREFGVNKNNINIISGAGDRLKLVKIVRFI